MSSRYRNLKNQQFGLLVAKEDIGRDTRGNAIWHCECLGSKAGDLNCKGTHTASSRALTYGSVKSCGCFKIAKAGLNRRKAKGQSGFNRYKHSVLGAAKIRGHRFELTDVQLFVLSQLPCAFCGATNTMVAKAEGKSSHGNFDHNSIDQVIPGGGYLLGNVVTLCKDHNRMKLNHELEDFFRLCFRALDLPTRGRECELADKIRHLAKQLENWDPELITDIICPEWMRNHV